MSGINRNECPDWTGIRIILISRYFEDSGHLSSKKETLNNSPKIEKISLELNDDLLKRLTGSQSNPLKTIEEHLKKHEETINALNWLKERHAFLAALLTTGETNPNKTKELRIKIETHRQNIMKWIDNYVENTAEVKNLKDTFNSYLQSAAHFISACFSESNGECEPLCVIVGNLYEWLDLESHKLIFPRKSGHGVKPPFCKAHIDKDSYTVERNDDAVYYKIFRNYSA